MPQSAVAAGLQPEPEPLPWFPRTKVQPPSPPPDVLDRAELVGRISRAILAHRLTLLSAPAGSGKTTILAALPSHLPEIALAWVSLSEDDNDVAVFLRGLLASLRRLEPGFGARTEPLLARLTDRRDDVRRVAATLTDELLDLHSDPVVLVLDDLHHLTAPAGLEVIEYLIGHLPPHVHLAVAARRDPPIALSRLRMRGYLAEFRFEDLSFTAPETAAWLGDRLDRHLPAEVAATVQQRTEGWPAGVRLLSLALQHVHEPADRLGLVARLARGQQQIFEVLAEEVLGRQDAEVRCFLLETSILTELTPAACRAVTGREDAALLLDDLYRHNLFLLLTDPVADASAGLSYRYHALFAEFLRRRLAIEMPERVGALHRQAALAQTVPATAIEHYLAAGAWTEAADLIEAVGRDRAALGGLTGLQRWIDALPEAERASRPWLDLLVGSDAIVRGDYHAAHHPLERARRAFAAAGHAAGEAEAMAQLAEIFTCTGDVARARPLLEGALDRPLSPAKRVKTEINLAWTAFFEGDWPQLDRRLVPLLRQVIASGDQGVYQSLVPSLGPPFPFGSVGIAPLADLCQRALDLFGDRVGPLPAAAHAYLGYLAALQGRFDAARGHADQGRRLCQELGGLGHAELMIDHVLLFDALIRADYPAFEETWHAAVPRVQRMATEQPYLLCYLYLRGRSLWLQGRRAEARSVNEHLRTIDDPHGFPESEIARLLMAGLIAFSDGRDDAALAVLDRATAVEQRTRHAMLLTNARLAAALVHHCAGNRDVALAALGSVLAELDERGMPGIALQEGRVILPLLRLAVAHGVHADVARRVLTLFGEEIDGHEATKPGDAILATPAGADPLSARELEVLRLIAAGLSNKEIGDRLFITAATAKRHSINLYAKLGVSSRTQAIAKGRELHLL